MKKLFLALLLGVTSTFALRAQSPEPSKIGWFLSPEFGTIFHGDHLGRTVGVALGLKLWRNRLLLGFQTYGRSGPINPTVFTIEAADGQTYRGSSTLRLRADHGAFGLLLAPVFDLGRWQLQVPLNVGGMGAGFYFTGEDRETPDGRRVSEWENQMMDSRDAGFGTWLEFGLRGSVALPTSGLRLGAGLHYLLTPGWETYFDPSGDFYNGRLRLALFVQLESY
ncbi:MAG: hypothetical protein AAF146_21890 [Bacteroidota bacterium]